MSTKPTLILLVLALFAAMGCTTDQATGESVPDWPKVAKAFDLAQAELGDIQATLTDEDLKAQIGDIMQAAGVAADAARGINPDNSASVFDVVIAVTDPLLGVVEDQKLTAAILAVRGAARMATLLIDDSGTTENP